VLDKACACVLGSMTSMATVALEEKRLQQLKQQLFGKSDSTPYKITSKQLKEVGGLTPQAKGTITISSPTLKSDLIRISLLSALAIGIQLSLFFAQKNGLLKIF